MPKKLSDIKKNFTRGLSEISRFWGFPKGMGAIFGVLYLSPEALSLDEIACRVGVSAFHLCRRFLRATGTTLHAHRTQLRMRCALERLGGGAEDLAALALDLGYATHSHFTTAFGRCFGIPPSAARSRLATPRGWQGLESRLGRGAPAQLLPRRR